MYAELGEIASGERAGRESDDEITVADLTGLGAQDGAVANWVVARAIDTDAGESMSNSGRSKAAELCDDRRFPLGGTLTRPAKAIRVGQPTRISFLLTNSSAPYVPSSRPEPDRLTPPNGSSAPSAPTGLTNTMPASIFSATRFAWSWSVVIT